MIEQVAIRRGAGFELILPAEWQAMARDERRSLLERGDVEFLAAGTVVPPRVALEMLSALPCG